ncbi:hypothetical protein [Streptomyces chrestomyceticus]|uniref:hypothetical protein n=1 Tax=Streptomyces chrestomyceticus TaxID=68185 RepID=UPI0019D25628|nr:hypothetical protein [Streptomyces chrestomyceticus]
MDWGDVAGWAAFGVSVGAFVISLKARGDGKRSADAAERSAAIAEEALAHQRQQDADRLAAEREASRPRVELRVEHATKAKWQIINVGTATARGVRLTEEVPALHHPWPSDLTLAPGELHDFLMAGSMQVPIPSVIYVAWEGQEDPVPLRVPPRVG